jgi:hypothetical protein
MLSTFHPGSGPRPPCVPRQVLLLLATSSCTCRYLMSTGASIPFDCMVFWWRLARKQRRIPSLFASHLPAGCHVASCRAAVASPLLDVLPAFQLPPPLFPPIHLLFTGLLLRRCLCILSSSRPTNGCAATARCPNNAPAIVLLTCCRQRRRQWPVHWKAPPTPLQQ